MDENSAIIEAILREQEEEEKAERNKNKSKDSQKGNEFSWQTVSYPKRNRKASKPPQGDNSADLPSYRPNGTAASADVFRSIEQHSEERRRRALDAQLAAKDAAGERSKRHSDDDEDSDAEVSVAAAENGEVKPKKQKKPKKPKVTVSEAASKIDVGDLSAFLIDITVSATISSNFTSPFFVLFDSSSIRFFSCA